MFAKLKKKVLEEEGEAGGSERLPFSPRKLPGGAVAVRSPLGAGPSVGRDGENESVHAEKRGEEEKGQKEKKEEAQPIPPPTVDLHPTVLPSHLQSSLTQEAVHQDLLTRIAQQRQELDALGQQLQEVGREREEERGAWREDTASKLVDKDVEIQALQGRFDKVDEEATELKLQIVELHIEKVDCEERLNDDVTRLKEQLSEMGQEKEEREKAWDQKREELENRVVELEESVSDMEFQVECFQDQVKTLETFKAETLSNMVKVSNDEILLKLQNEIIDLERRLHSKTMDMEMARIDADTQMKWKEEQLQEGVTRQVTLMASEKQLKDTVAEINEELRELRLELEKERMDGGKREREVAHLNGELDKANKNVDMLENKMEEMQSAHDRHLHEIASQRDQRVAELSKALEELRGEILGSETVATPMRNPLDFTSVATQTAPPPPPEEEEEEEELENAAPAILQVDAFPNTSMNGMEAGSEAERREEEGTPTMEPHGLIEELQLLRQEQLRLQEEVTEKNKLVRFQQLKIVDMRKALNKELRSQASVELVTPPPHISHSHMFPSPPWVRGNGGTSPGPTPGGQITSCEDVNIRYLKHVIIKFLCSREDEATQLIRAVSTLLNFTSQEEQFVKDYFDYKMSWFGSMPKPLYHPVRNFNPS